MTFYILTASLKLEDTSWERLIHPPCSKNGDPQQFVQGHEHLHSVWSTSPLKKKNKNQNVFLCSDGISRCKPFLSCPVRGHCCEGSGSLFFILSSEVYICTLVRSAPLLIIFSRLNSPWSLSLPPSSTLLVILVALSWTRSSKSMSLYARKSHSRFVSPVLNKERFISLSLWMMLFLMQPRTPLSHPCCDGVLLAYGQHVVHQDPEVLPLRAAFLGSL